jgi:hypothetical protein
MATDNTAKLAKMMKTPEDALRAARLPQDRINDMVRRARAAKVQGRIFGILSLALLAAAFALAGRDDWQQFTRLIGFLATASFASFSAWGFTKSPSKITAEAATAMQRRLVDLDRHCPN